MEDHDWFIIENPQNIDSPALLIFTERMKSNLQSALHISANPANLRPHVKTSKIAEVCAMMLQAGITRFKCATIAEAEMLAILDAPDVLLAYQPVGPKLERFLALVNAYPNTYFSCLVDNEASATALSTAATKTKQQIAVYIDVNIGMNRTGVKPEQVPALAVIVEASAGLQLEGLHAYDGHIHEEDLVERKQNCDDAMEAIFILQEQLETLLGRSIRIVAGGTPTFTIHANRGNVECSPGTFIFWDQGYSTQLPDLPFRPAAVLLTRVVSIVDAQTICTDLGHKSVASEMPFPRVSFLNAPGATPLAQSEEHLTLTVSDSSSYKPGDLLYAIPWHICPTVALYEKVYAVEENMVTGEWQTVARNRYITI